MHAWFLDSYALTQHFFSHILFIRASHRSRLDSRDGKNRHFPNGDEKAHSKEYYHLSILTTQLMRNYLITFKIVMYISTS